jgi:hypothetical protein
MTRFFQTKQLELFRKCGILVQIGKKEGTTEPYEDSNKRSGTKLPPCQEIITWIYIKNENSSWIFRYYYYILPPICSKLIVVQQIVCLSD